MISDADVAKKISDAMLDVYRQINESIHVVMESCPENEFKVYRLAAARILLEMHTEVFTPLYVLHPELKPEGYP
jgi:hypothetical protein